MSGYFDGRFGAALRPGLGAVFGAGFVVGLPVFVVFVGFAAFFVTAFGDFADAGRAEERAGTVRAAGFVARVLVGGLGCPAYTVSAGREKSVSAATKRQAVSPGRNIAHLRRI
jgi:hypothetical protein